MMTREPLWTLEGQGGKHRPTLPDPVDLKSDRSDRDWRDIVVDLLNRIEELDRELEAARRGLVPTVSIKQIKTERHDAYKQAHAALLKAPEEFKSFAEGYRSDLRTRENRLSGQNNPALPWSQTEDGDDLELPAADPPSVIEDEQDVEAAWNAAERFLRPAVEAGYLDLIHFYALRVSMARDFAEMMIQISDDEAFQIWVDSTRPDTISERHLAFFLADCLTDGVNVSAVTKGVYPFRTTQHGNLRLTRSRSHRRQMVNALRRIVRQAKAGITRYRAETA